MSKQFITAAALVVALLPFVQTSAQARHINVYPVAPVAPAVVVPHRTHVDVMRPAYPAVRVYPHRMYRVYPRYRVDVR